MKSLNESKIGIYEKKKSTSTVFDSNQKKTPEKTNNPESNYYHDNEKTMKKINNNRNKKYFLTNMKEACKSKELNNYFINLYKNYFNQLKKEVGSFNLLKPMNNIQNLVFIPKKQRYKGLINYFLLYIPISS